MKKIILTNALLLIFLLCVVVVQSQTVINCSKIATTNFKNLTSRFTNYQIFSIPTNTISSKISHTNESVSNIVLAFEQFKQFDLSLYAKNILASDYFLQETGVQGNKRTYQPNCITYTGKLYHSSNSVVSLTITNDFFYGFIKANDKEYYFEPLFYYDATAAQNYFVVYEKNDVVLDNNLKCAVTETNEMANTYRPTAGTGCFITEIAIASDASMFTRYGTVAAVEAHNIGVMNNVQVDYLNNAFNDNIEFKIVTQNVSTSVANDQLTPAYTGTNCNTILPNFRTWGNNGGFGVSYDIASFWTTRDFDTDGAGTNNGVIGLAFVGVVCGTSRYNILEDFAGSNPSGSGFQLRVLTSHEIGHNFNLSHDASGTFIMAPSVVNTATWSATSISTLNTFTSSLSAACKNTCAVGLPITDFFSSSNSVCTGAPTPFTDYTFGGPTSWSWTFEGGTPATSTVRNPVVTFATVGVKTVTLNATNANGTSSKTKSILVAASPVGVTGCTISGTNTTDGGIRGFSLAGMSNSSSLPSGQSGAVYVDYSCSKIASLTANTTYTGSITVGTTTPANAFNHQDVYIDYDNSGSFIGTERVYSSGGSANIGTVNFTFTTPANPTTNTLLRMRVIARTFTAAETSCPTPANMSGAEVEDYGVGFATILPMNEITFTGIKQNDKDALLKWTVANELNYNAIILEKSTDGISYSFLYNSNLSNNSFTYNDANITTPIAYYRLHIVDKSNTTTYSNIVKLTFSKTGSFVMAVLPNPFTTQLTLQLNNTKIGKYSFALFDTKGTKVYTANALLNVGNVTHTLNGLGRLANGTYFLQITNGIDNFRQKIVKQ